MSANLIPDNTIARVKVRIRPGGYDEASQGWTDGFASRSDKGVVYLNADFTVLDGVYAGRMVFFPIGLRSPKGPLWGTKGRRLMRDIVNSANGFSPDDFSSKAIQTREHFSIGDLDGIEFIAVIKTSKNQSGNLENVIAKAVTSEKATGMHKPNKLRRKDITEVTGNRRNTPMWTL